MPDKKVFIVVLNYNSVADTIECVNSLRQIDYPLHEIILVDNGSDNDEASLLRKTFPDLVLIQTGSNLGYAKGNNVGIRYAIEKSAPYVWILNNDTVVAPDTLSEMIALAESDPRIGMVGCKIYFYSEKDVLWYAGATFEPEKGGVTSHLGWGRRDTGQFDAVVDVGYITGCSLLAKREVVEKVGLMPEEYFLYFEETDWNYSAQQAGYRTVISTKAKMWHKVKRKGEAQVRFIYYMTRNRFLLIRKIKPSAFKQCVRYQYGEGVKLLRDFWGRKQYGLFFRFLRVLTRAWYDGVISSRTGEVKISN